MAVGLAARRRGAAVQAAQPWAGLRTVWVRVWGRVCGRMWVRPPLRLQRPPDIAVNDTMAWADTQPTMFWNPLPAATDEA